MQCPYRTSGKVIKVADIYAQRWIVAAGLSPRVPVDVVLEADILSLGQACLQTRHFLFASVNQPMPFTRNLFICHRRCIILAFGSVVE